MQTDDQAHLSCGRIVHATRHQLASPTSQVKHRRLPSPPPLLHLGHCCLSLVTPRLDPCLSFVCPLPTCPSGASPARGSLAISEARLLEQSQTRYPLPNPRFAHRHRVSATRPNVDKVSQTVPSQRLGNVAMTCSPLLNLTTSGGVTTRGIQREPRRDHGVHASSSLPSALRSADVRSLSSSVTCKTWTTLQYHNAFVSRYRSRPHTAITGGTCILLPQSDPPIL
ncbi:hypothetical protein F5X68DRAFT_57779 [Plectosphaerella plurivora]|uniref:Uncharacterized protein n=1 Tax=Plectosphaerella plurivora TaxID=936078 RepID=A0A9P8VG65_9PEZI|nr:hypothetical protein F5X68DRAFT_57779 [Plectosphaerella plurivora]